MEVKTLRERPELKEDRKLRNSFDVLDKLIAEIRKKKVPEELVEFINQYIEAINRFSGTDQELYKRLREALEGILKRLERELKMVPKYHYRKLWLAIGMAAIGVPLGIVFGIGLGNMAFLGIGLPMGMAVGIAIGVTMDRKVCKSGNQLDLEIEL